MICKTKIVIPNRKYSTWSKGNNPAAWKQIAEYTGKDVQPIYTIPDNITDHWKANKNALGYTNFVGLTPDDTLLIIALAKASKARLGINRWGHVSSYKLVV